MTIEKLIIKGASPNHNGEKDNWYREWFLPTHARVVIDCVSWESLIECIAKNDRLAGKGFQRFYADCLECNNPKRF